MLDLFSTAMAGANLVGSLFETRENNQNFARNLHEQRVFAQNGIQWRVQDAVAAGIHPLFAMGAPGANFTPVYMPPNGVGEAAGRAAALLADGYEPLEDLGSSQEGGTTVVRGRAKSMAQMRRENERQLARRQRKLMQAEDDLVQLQVDTAREQLAQLRAARNNESALTGRDDADKHKQSAWAYKQNEVASPMPNKPHITAGPDTPAWTRFRIRPNISMIAPGGSSFSEALESLEGTTPKLFVIAANMAEFGSGWLDQVAKELNWSKAKKAQVYEQVIPFLVP